jgi:hypothetical protein
MKTEEINLVSISIYVEGVKSLFILLDKGGTINRSGCGRLRNKDKILFIKREKEHFFQKLMECVPEDWSELQGVYKIDIPDKKGANCELRIIFKDKADKDYGFVVLYGAKSEGPAEDIGEMVVNAVQITDPWFNEQKRMLKNIKKRQANKKPWWKP